MTLELANREICTPVGIARDVFVLVAKFTFPADFVIVDYEIDPRVPLILGRPFLRTARALIDVHGEERILRDGNERLILNMRHDTSSYSNGPHQESINMINVYNVSHEEILKDLFATNHPSGNPTSSSHPDLTSPEVNDDIFDPEEDIIENLLNLDKTKDLPPYHDNPLSGNPTPISEPETKSSSPTLTSIEESDLIWEKFEAHLASDPFPPRNSNPSSPISPFHNSLSGSTTSSSPSLLISETSDYSLEEFADELAHITFLPGNDDLPFDAEPDLREIEYMLNHDPIMEMDSILKDSVDSLDDNLVDTISEMFTDEHALDYSSPPLWDDYDDELFDLETVNDNTYDDPFDSKEEKIKESKLLIDELDLPGSSDFLPSPECGLVFYVDFSEVDALSSTNNEDKVFNPGILIHENLYEVTNLATMEKNVKKTTNASLILKDFNPPLYELPFHKEVPGLGILLSFSSENEEKVFNPGILTSKRVHTSLLPELSHRGSKAFKVIKIFESPMEIFPCSYGEDIRILDVSCTRYSLKDKTKPNRTKPRAELERARKTEAKDTKGLKTELKRTFPDRLDNVCAINEVKTKSKSTSGYGTSNTRNQVAVQDGRVDIQTKNVGYGGNADGNAETVPLYDAKGIGEINASSKDHEQVSHVKCKTSIQPSNDDQIDSNIIFDDLYVENNGGTSEHDSNAHDEYHEIQMLAYNVQGEAENKKRLKNELKKQKELLQKDV
ncbi:reverse transcriptase domain-containing protein [Tanacetum coccineum]